MSNVDVVAVLNDVIEAHDHEVNCGGQIYTHRRSVELARDAVAELIAADEALDELMQMPAQPECVVDFPVMVAAAKRRRAAALAVCKPTHTEGSPR